MWRLSDARSLGGGKGGGGGVGTPPTRSAFGIAEEGKPATLPKSASIWCRRSTPVPHLSRTKIGEKKRKEPTRTDAGYQDPCRGALMRKLSAVMSGGLLSGVFSSLFLGMFVYV